MAAFTVMLSTPKAFAGELRTISLKLAELNAATPSAKVNPPGGTESVAVTEPTGVPLLNACNINGVGTVVWTTKFMLTFGMLELNKIVSVKPLLVLAKSSISTLPVNVLKKTSNVAGFSTTNPFGSLELLKVAEMPLFVSVNVVPLPAASASKLKTLVAMAAEDARARSAKRKETRLTLCIVPPRTRIRPQTLMWAPLILTPSSESKLL